MYSEKELTKMRHNQTPINFKNSQTFQNYYYSHPNQSIYYQLQTKGSQNDTQKIPKRELSNHLNSFLEDCTQFQKSDRTTNRQLVQINKNLSKACLKIQQLSNKSLSKQKNANINKSSNKGKSNKVKCIHKITKQNVQQEYFQQIQKKIGRFYQPEDEYQKTKNRKNSDNNDYDIGGSHYRRIGNLQNQNKQNQNCYSNFVYEVKKQETIRIQSQKSKVFQLNDQKQMLYIQLKKNISSKNLLIKNLQDKIQILKQENLIAQKQFLKKQSKLLQQINQLQQDNQFLQNQCQIYLTQINLLNDKVSKTSKEDSSINTKKYNDLGNNFIEVVQLCMNWTNLMRRAKQQELPATAFMVRQDLMLKKYFFSNLHMQLSKQFDKNQNKNQINENQSLLLKNSYLQDQKFSKKKVQKSLMKCSSIDVIRQSLSTNKNGKKNSKQSLKKNIYSKSKSQNKQIINYKSKSKKENGNKQNENNNQINTVNSDYHSETMNTNSDKCENKSKAIKQGQVIFESVKKELFCLQKGTKTLNLNQQLNLQQIYRLLLIQAHQIQQNHFAFQQIKQKET